MHETKTAILACSVLPVLAMAVPLAGAALAALAGEKRARLRNWAATAATGLTLLIAVLVLVKVLGVGSVYFNLNILRIGGSYACNLQVDAMGAFFVFFAALLWFAASLHAFRYMEHEKRRTRFFFFMLLTESATLGVFMVHDFFSLYLFFEAMGLFAYVLVIHSETEKARAAASKYICMTVVGGLSLIGGIFLYLGAAGTVAFKPLADSAWLGGPFRVAAVVFLIAGFGVKAGMVPLHIWLPDAHPAAPSPASALLSGVMIKAGAYGILRTVLTFLQEPAAPGVDAGAAGGACGMEAAASGLAGDVRLLGLAIIWIAVATMFAGMLLALVQNDIKRTLAYSSVSQMGYILFGVGCMAYLGAEGAMGMGGSLYHVINHAFFKGCFFLAAGCILFCVHELNMFRLGGLWRRMPLTTVFWCIAALGIMGIPPWGGFVSKTLLHHAIVEAHHLAEHANLATGGWIVAAEVMFVIVSGGTIAYIAKMTYYTFFRRPGVEREHHLERVKEAPAWMLAGTGLLAAGVVFNGLFPGVLLGRLVGPAVETVRGFDPHMASHMAEEPIFLWKNVKEIFVPLAIGASVFAMGAWPDLLGRRRRGPDLFHLRLPRRLGVDYWYVRGAKGALATLFAGRRAYASARAAAAAALRRGASGTARLAREAAARTQGLCLRAGEGMAGLWEYSSGRLPPRIREYRGDIAAGTLALAVSLAVFVVMMLL